MCSIAVLLFISGVTALTSSHDFLLSLLVLRINYWWILQLLSCFTFLGTIFHILPITGPLLSPFKFEIATKTDFGCEAVLNLGFHLFSYLFNALIIDQAQ